MGYRDWRDAASVILTAVNKQQTIKGHVDYRVLAVKRSQFSKFMASSYVFPGGTTDPADSNEKWLSHFKRFNVNLTENMPAILPPVAEISETILPKLISLKITAIRETFEEAGILLCRDGSSKKSGSWSVFKSGSDLESWRTRIYRNPTEFFHLCHENDCYPDVLGIHLWSNWLTPRRGNKKRFDTAFFVASLEEEPPSVPDRSEIQRVTWLSPQLMDGTCNQDLHLPPPQVYELGRLLRFNQIQELATFAEKRSLLGCERWMPEIVNTSDGTVTILPGDDAYQGNYSVTETENETENFRVNMSTKEFRSMSKVLHRIEYGKNSTRTVVVENYIPKYGHVLPLT